MGCDERTNFHFPFLSSVATFLAVQKKSVDSSILTIMTILTIFMIFYNFEIFVTFEIC